MTRSGLRLSPMRRRDLREVLAVEHTVFPEPWSQAVFSSELALRHGRWYRVAREGKALAGYVGLLFVEDEAHVTTVAVVPGFQGRGVATTMLVEGIQHSVGLGIRQVSLEVAASNERAQALYRRFGFVPVGVRKGYYPKTGEDALVMFAYDVHSPEYAARLDRLAAQAEAARAAAT